jgi:hypothetical protein
MYLKIVGSCTGKDIDGGCVGIRRRVRLLGIRGMKLQEDGEVA